MRNARFIVYLNGNYTKLTLRPDQTLRWSNYRRTDEGWDSTYIEYWYDAEQARIVRTVESDGVDCDGRLRHLSRCAVTLDRLASFVGHDEVTLLPDWKTVKESQRDYSAEAQGY